LNNFVVILLIVASVISALLGDYVEAAAIMAIVVLNSILGIVQERRAEEALAALRKLAAPDAQVMRDGHRVSVPSYDLVPGDLVFLESGNFVPADIRLLEAVNLRVEEAWKKMFRSAIARIQPSWGQLYPTVAGAAW
jgi:Ca2+-transporting ATPase